MIMRYECPEGDIIMGFITPIMILLVRFRENSVGLKPLCKGEGFIADTHGDVAHGNADRCLSGCRFPEAVALMARACQL